MLKKISNLSVVMLFFLFACSNAEENKAQQATEKTTTSQGFPNSGKVIRAMHGGGYTYMKIENNGTEFWIASTMINVKRNDIVNWTDASLMKDFKSSTLRRTFDEILFVTAASVKK